MRGSSMPVFVYVLSVPVAGSYPTTVGPLAPRIHANRPSFSLGCSHTATGSLFTGQPSPAASVIVRMSSRRTDVPLLTYAYHGVAGLVENAKAWSCTGARLPPSWRPLLTPTPGVKSTSQYAPPCTRTARAAPLYGRETSSPPYAESWTQ